MIDKSGLMKKNEKNSFRQEEKAGARWRGQCLYISLLVMNRLN